jgi:hypothetical protein
LIPSIVKELSANNWARKSSTLPMLPVTTAPCHISTPATTMIIQRQKANDSETRNMDHGSSRVTTRCT